MKIAFHYSDFWADPGKQMSPKAWRGMDIHTRAKALYDFTYDSVKALLEAGVDLGIVAVGNENNAGIDGAGMAGADGHWDTPEQAVDLLKLFKAGTEATRKAEKECNAKDLEIAVHIANPEVPQNYINFADRLAEAKIDYDLFGSSYYPFWHGTLENLTDVLTKVSQKHNIDVFCVETSYPTTIDDGDAFEVYPIKYGEEHSYAISPQGQANAIRDVCQAIADVPNKRGRGVFLWEPCWIPVGSPSNWEHNFAIWQEHGSGWASSYASSYNPQIKGMYGGSGWDNKSLFDFEGHPLPSLTIFKDIDGGREADVEIDVIESCEADGIDNLPKTVLAIYNDNSKKQLPVTWDIAGLDKLGHGVHHIVVKGTISGQSKLAECTLRITPKNLLKNGGFEDEDMTMWRVNTPYATRRSTCPKMGSYSFGFTRPVPLPAQVNIEQDVQIDSDGTYSACAFLSGDCAKIDAENSFRMYVKINGTEQTEVHIDLPGYRKWSKPEIAGLHLNSGDMVTIGFDFAASKGINVVMDDVYFHRNE